MLLELMLLGLLGLLDLLWVAVRSASRWHVSSRDLNALSVSCVLSKGMQVLLRVGTVSNSGIGAEGGRKDAGVAQRAVRYGGSASRVTMKVAVVCTVIMKFDQSVRARELVASVDRIAHKFPSPCRDR